MEKFMHSELDICFIGFYEAYQIAKIIPPVFNRKSYCITLIEEGKGRTVYTDGTVVEYKHGDITFNPNGSSYHLEVDKPFNCLNIAFRLMEDIEEKPFVFHAQNDPKLCERFRTILNVWNAKKPGYREKTLSEFYAIIHTMKKHYFTDYSPTEKYNVIKPAMEYIHANYHSGRIKIEDLSRLCEISPEYFRNIFRKINGTSPLDYIQNLQITYAKQLIDSGAYSITQISSMLGFSETSEFSRRFKKVTGISPRDYLKSRN